MAHQPDDLRYKMQIAVQRLEEAEYFEKAGDLETAISKYEEAAHLLSQASFPHEKIAEIYNRINALKQSLVETSVQQAMNQEAESQQLEDEAFQLIDYAETALAAGKIGEAIRCYEEALPRLETVGYSTQHVRDKLVELKAIMPPKPVMKSPAGVVKPAGMKPVKPAVTAPSPVVKSVKPATTNQSPVVKPMKPVGEAQQVAPSAAQTQKFLEFQESREKVEEIEGRAFALIDEAKLKTESGDYTDALTLYGMVGNLLKNAGWTDDQIEPIHVQEQLVMDIMNSQARSPATTSASQPEAKPVMGPGIMADQTQREVEQKLDLMEGQRERMEALKAASLKRQDEESYAFELIKEAQKLYKYVEVSKDLPAAVKLLEEAIQLLRKAGWTDQVPFLVAELEQVRAMHEREILEKQAEEEAKELEILAEQEKVARETAKEQAVVDNLKEITSLLGSIHKKQQKDQEKAEEESIKQQLLEEKRLKTLVARTGQGKSLDSLKDMLFGDKDAKAEAEREAKKKQMEQDFLSTASKRFFEMKKEAQSAASLTTVEAVVDVVHKGAVATQKPAETPVMGVVDLKSRQELEEKKAKEEKEQAVGDVLSMLSSIKKEVKDKEKDTMEETGAGKSIPDEELKKMFDNIKAKKDDGE